ncbi:MAG TPA: PAS domain S-box protein [Chloroflexota bacterium]|nr:PAS domain S-box protein [Chloroflexota bacterium]
MAEQARADGGDLLVVDDEESVLVTMQAILLAAGHRADAAGTRADALEALERKTFDVVVSDLHLDEGDGLEVIAAAKRRSPTTAGIILTGYGSFEAVTRALRAGVDDFVVKPTDVEELKRTIARCVRKSREAQRLAAAAQEAEEARRAEAALRQSEQRFRLLANAAPIMIWAASPEGRCTFLNRRWLEFTGQALDDQLEDGWFEGVHPEDRERCRQAFDFAFERRTPFRIEFRLRRADGDYRWVEDDGAPYETPEGAFGGFIGTCSDVTERRQQVLEREAALQRERTARVEAEVEAELARAEAEAAEAALKAGRSVGVPGTPSPPSQRPTPSLPLPPRQAPPKPPTSAVGLVRKSQRRGTLFSKPPRSAPDA